MMTSGMGVVEGGWEYVWAAYGATAVILLGYAVTLLARYRALRGRAARAEGATEEPS
jgi:heme exporter protein CcmD